MTWEGKSVLVVVPARGGSKGIPRKNLSLVGGLSLIQHVAKVVSQLDWVDAAVLSTDDIEIAEHGINCGLDSPFMRPDYLATDEASSIDMWRHSWLECEAMHNKTYDVSILLEPTSPMRTPQDIEAAITLLVKSKRSAVVTVSPTPAHFTPEKLLKLDHDNVISFYLESGASHFRRQTIPKYYHRNGICYVVTRDSLINRKNIIQDDCTALIIKHAVVNIDEPIDLEWAEFLYAKLEN